MPATLIRIFTVTSVCLLMLGCDSDNTQGTSGWTVDPSVFNLTIGDGVGDFATALSEEPVYDVSYSPVDIVSLSFGADDEYLYVKAIFNDLIPTDHVQVGGDGVVEEQTVHQHDVTINIDADNNPNTGAPQKWSGVDLYFGILFRYGSGVEVYANYGFDTGDVHEFNGSVTGSWGEGGPGTNYIIVRFELSSLSHLMTKGQTVTIIPWTEAESNLYHHYAFDDINRATWTIP